jgi:hypothetical protein
MNDTTNAQLDATGGEPLHKRLWFGKHAPNRTPIMFNAPLKPSFKTVVKAPNPA